MTYEKQDPPDSEQTRVLPVRDCGSESVTPVVARCASRLTTAASATAAATPYAEPGVRRTGWRFCV